MPDLYRSILHITRQVTACDLQLLSPPVGLAACFRSTFPYPLWTEQLNDVKGVQGKYFSQEQQTKQEKGGLNRKIRRLIFLGSALVSFKLGI